MSLRGNLPVALGNQIICVKWFTCLSEVFWSPRNPAKVLHDSLTFTMRTTKIRFFSNEQIFITRTSSPFAAKELQESRSSSLKDNGKTRGWHLVCKKEWLWWSFTMKFNIELECESKSWGWKTDYLHFLAGGDLVSNFFWWRSVQLWGG